MITESQFAIMNALSDDFENLEQIFKSICLDFSGEAFDPSNANLFYWRESEYSLPLATIADDLVSLWTMKLVDCRMEHDSIVVKEAGNYAFVWKGWFGLTQEGRQLLPNAT